eukprot:5501610-Pyramimonas_sp.AAC.1
MSALGKHVKSTRVVPVQQEPSQRRIKRKGRSVDLEEKKKGGTNRVAGSAGDAADKFVEHPHSERFRQASSETSM